MSNDDDLYWNLETTSEGRHLYLCLRELCWWELLELGLALIGSQAAKWWAPRRQTEQRDSIRGKIEIIPTRTSDFQRQRGNFQSGSFISTIVHHQHSPTVAAQTTWKGPIWVNFPPYQLYWAGTVKTIKLHFLYFSPIEWYQINLTAPNNSN